MATITIKRTKLADRVLPDYTILEERLNSISHFAGVLLALPVLILFPAIAAAHDNIQGIVGSAIFGSSLLLLYLISGLYHGLPSGSYVKKVFQVIDHCTIFALIAGSYTAFVMGTLFNEEPVSAIVILSIVWVAAIIGIVLNAIDLKRYEVFSMICYITMGWIIIIKAPVLFRLMEHKAFILLVLGGVMYTVGAVFYGIGKKHHYSHLVFHIFTLLGSLLHVICAGICLI